MSMLAERLWIAVHQSSTFIALGIGFLTGFMIKAAFPSITDKKSNITQCEEWDEDGFLSESKGQFKLVLVVRSDLKMGKGKMAAQCSHATLKAYKQVSSHNKPLLKAWEQYGQPKVVVRIEDETSLLALAAETRAAGLTVSLIQDAGRTQVMPGSRTVLGVGPGPADVIDKFTGHLKLL